MYIVITSLVGITITAMVANEIYHFYKEMNE